MADALDLAIAQGPPRVDFSPLSTLFNDYTQGVKNKASVDAIQAFKGGVPTLADGTPDYNAMATKLYQAGDLSNANALSTIGAQRAPLQFLPGALKALNGGQSATPSAGTPSVIPNYFGKLATQESSNNPNASNPNSTSQGLYGFTAPTWQAVMQAHPELGLTPDGMKDPLQATKAVQAFTADNAGKLTSAGYQPHDQNLYLAHFLGADGANSFLKGMSADPNAPAASMVGPAAVKANYGLFFDKNTNQPLSAQQFYTNLTGKFAGGNAAGGAQPASVGASSISATNPALTGLVPPNTDPNQYLVTLRQYAAVLSSNPQTAALGKLMGDRVAAIEKAMEPTAELKNYYADRKPGESLSDYQARTAGQVEGAKVSANNAALTPEQKNYLADRRPGESLADYKSRVGQQEEAAKVPAEMYKDAAKDYKSSQAATYRLGLIDKSIDALGPDWMGTAANTRGAAARAWNTLTGMLPTDVAKEVQIDPRKIATWEDFTKQTQTLGFELARTLGSREAQMIVQQATNSVPNAQQSQLGAKLVSSSLQQAAQRQQDYYEFLTARAKAGTLMGADVDFNRAHPVQGYVDAAIKKVGVDPATVTPGATPAAAPGTPAGSASAKPGAGSVVVQNGFRFRINPDGTGTALGPVAAQ